MGDELSIALEVYLPFRGRTPWRGTETLPAGTTVGDLPGLLGLNAAHLSVLVGGRYAPATTVLNAGDEVAILWQAEGGD